VFEAQTKFSSSASVAQHLLKKKMIFSISTFILVYKNVGIRAVPSSMGFIFYFTSPKYPILP